MQTIRDAFHLYFRHFAFILCVTALVHAPLNAFVAYLDWYVLDESNLSLRIAMMLDGVFGPICIGAIVFVLGQTVNGRTVTTLQAYAAGFKYWWPLFATNFLAGLHILVGLLLFIVPGIIFALNYSFIDYVVVVEKKTGTTALQRSKELTAGIRIKLLFCYFLFFLFVGVPAAVLYMALELIPLWTDTTYFVLEVIVDTSMDVVSACLLVLCFVFFWNAIGGASVRSPTCYDDDEFAPNVQNELVNIDDSSNPYRTPQT